MYYTSVKLLLLHLLFLFSNSLCINITFNTNTDPKSLYHKISTSTVMIVRSSNSSVDNKKNFIAYGSLIHPKAVLTLSKLIYKEEIENVQVQGDCYAYSELDINAMYCSSISKISEITITDNNYQIKNDSYYTDKIVIDYAILILVQPFEVNSRLKIFDLIYNDSAIRPYNCKTYALANIWYNSTYTSSFFIRPFRVHVTNDEILVQNPIDNKRLPPYFDLKLNDTIKFMIDLRGSPILCQLNGTKTYGQLAMSNFAVYKSKRSPVLPDFVRYTRAKNKYFPRWFSHVEDILMINRNYEIYDQIDNLTNHT